MGKAKCNLPESEHEAALRLFPQYLDAEEEDRVRGMFPQYLFFHNDYDGDDSGLDATGKPVRVCHCTNCRQSFTAVRGNYARGKMHHERLNCPECGVEMEGIAVYKYSYNMPSMESWIKTAVARLTPDGALLIEAGNARRSFNWDDLDGEIDWQPTKRYYMKRGAVQMWSRVTIWEGCYPVGHDWVPTKTVADPFMPNLMGYANYYGDYTVVGLDRIYQSKDWRYCQIGDFYHYTYAADLFGGDTARWIVKYLAWYALHPQIEMAVKFGFMGAVADLVERGTKNAQLLNWDATNPPDFLRLGKKDAAAFLATGGDFEELRIWRETCKGLSLDKFHALSNRIGKANLPTLRDCAKAARVDMQKAARYIESLLPACARYATVTPAQILQMWSDYLGMADQLGYDLKAHGVAMPKDLQERHDAAAATVRINANQAEMKKYKYRRRKLEKQYAFTMGGYSVLVPVSSQEIVQEGKTLHHCVGGYAARHIEGVTTILFLRREKTPARSFLTIEMEKARGQIKIQQIHGYKNEGYKNAVSPRKKFAWFLDVWLDWVNHGSERDKDGRPVLPEEKEEIKTA
jgi:hypothetical protein